MKPLIAALFLLIALPVRTDFTLGLTVPAWVGWDEGLAAYDRGDYATALREWRPLARFDYPSQNRCRTAAASVLRFCVYEPWHLYGHSRSI